MEKSYGGQKAASEFVEKVVQIDRVTKVVKGGKRMAFRAMVIVGDKKGRVAIGLGKSKEVPIAIRKGIERAKKRLKKINIVRGTIPHAVIADFGASKVLLKPAPMGTGVIAGGAVRILLESAGVHNVVAKSLGSGNALNAAHATLKGLTQLKDIAEEENIRGVKLGSVARNFEKEKERGGSLNFQKKNEERLEVKPNRAAGQTEKKSRSGFKKAKE